MTPSPYGGYTIIEKDPGFIGAYPDGWAEGFTEI